MKAMLYFDMMTAEDPEVRRKLESFQISSLARGDSSIMDAFERIRHFCFCFIKLLLELSFTISLVRKQNISVVFALISLVQPSLMVLGYSGLYMRSLALYCSNTAYSRILAVLRLAHDEKFRWDRFSDNINWYLEKDFEQCRHALGETFSDNIHAQWHRRSNSSFRGILSLSQDLSLLFFALKVLWDPRGLTLSSLAISEQSSKTRQRSIIGIHIEGRMLMKYLMVIKDQYALSEVKNRIKDGKEKYPRDSKEKTSGGAKVAFKNVSFAYPGMSKNALQGVSFSIKPGQLVVIVGVNGSGKSLIVKLLNRLYDPSEGEIHLDGLGLSSYNLEDVRRCTPTFRQDHSLYPLSLRENVALGLPDRKVTEGELQAAIQKGGSDKIVGKLAEGLDTVLDPVKTALLRTDGGPDPELKVILNKKEVHTDLSGGETQRLAASRAFMRLGGGHIRLMIADEPTSALDPEGEYESFSRLREHSKGMTSIFITHRFGHLTKHAYLILCLKDGQLIESGTHEELIEKGREYTRLHNIQAKAFTKVS